MPLKIEFSPKVNDLQSALENAASLAKPDNGRYKLTIDAPSRITIAVQEG